jgi:hypothetical protein
VSDDNVKCVQIGERVWKYHESVGWYDALEDDPVFGDEELLLDEIERLREQNEYLKSVVETLLAEARQAKYGIEDTHE